MNRKRNVSALVLIGIVLVLVLMPMPLFAFNDSAKSPIVTENENPKLKAPITIVARESSLSEVLKVLSECSAMNFVAGEGVHREKITIILNKTPLDEAIDLLVRAAGLSYEIIGNSVLIGEPGKLKEEVGQSGYVIELKYAQAGEVAAMLSDITKNIKVDEGGNRLICYTSPRVIREIERIVMSIDKPHVLVMLETRLVEVSMGNIDKYGIGWGDIMPVKGGLRYPTHPLTDGFAKQNWLQAATDFNITLDMLIENGDARILMDSKLTTTNNREARLHIGEKIPYIIQSFNLSGNGGASQQVMKEEVGVIIKMTPHINEEGQITLALEPEVSSISGWKGPSADIPLVRVRKTSTTVRVEDGQTILIAGLISEEKNSTIHMIPILGQIPLLGFLFQHKREDLKKTNLIIEITPHIVKNPADISFTATLNDTYFDHKNQGGKSKRVKRSHTADQVKTKSAVEVPQTAPEKTLEKSAPSGSDTLQPMPVTDKKIDTGKQ